jgi:transcriptional regulator with XRE-family HTH domain
VSRVSNKKIIQSYSAEVTISDMPKSRLPDLIDKAKATGLSYRDIQRRAGGESQIAVSTIQLAHKGQSDNLTLNKILALARGLGESPTVVFEAAIGKVSTGVRDESFRQLLEDFARLRPRDKDELAPIFEMLRTEIQKRLDRNA